MTTFSTRPRRDLWADSDGTSKTLGTSMADSGDTTNHFIVTTLDKPWVRFDLLFGGTIPTLAELRLLVDSDLKSEEGAIERPAAVIDTDVGIEVRQAASGGGEVKVSDILDPPERMYFFEYFGPDRKVTVQAKRTTGGDVDTTLLVRAEAAEGPRV